MTAVLVADWSRFVILGCAIIGCILTLVITAWFGRDDER